MSIFGNILGKIFPSSHPAVAATSDAATAAPTPDAGSPAPAASDAPAAAATPPVDVNAVLEGYASKNPQQLNWQTSIVDLLKLLSLDSSHDARLSLAKELNFTGDTNDSASMNIWLHKAVMQKLEENGGTVPDSLKH